MNSKEKDFERIEKYFHFEMDEDELALFDQRIHTNAQLAQLVQVYKESDSIVSQIYKGASEKDRTQQWRTLLNENTDSKTRNIQWRWIASIAASLLVLIGLWKINEYRSKPNLSQLIAASWNQHIGLDYNTTRGIIDTDAKTIIKTAFDYYEDHKYTLALKTLKPFILDTEFYEDALLLRGLSYYKLENVDKAILSLDSLSKYPSRKKAKVARWYMGLIHLELGNRKAAGQFISISKKKISVIELKE